MVEGGRADGIGAHADGSMATTESGQAEADSSAIRDGNEMLVARKAPAAADTTVARTDAIRCSFCKRALPPWGREEAVPRGVRVRKTDGSEACGMPSACTGPPKR